MSASSAVEDAHRTPSGCQRPASSRRLGRPGWWGWKLDTEARDGESHQGLTRGQEVGDPGGAQHLKLGQSCVIRGAAGEARDLQFDGVVPDLCPRFAQESPGGEPVERSEDPVAERPAVRSELIVLCRDPAGQYYVDALVVAPARRGLGDLRGAQFAACRARLSLRDRTCLDRGQSPAVSRASSRWAGRSLPSFSRTQVLS